VKRLVLIAFVALVAAPAAHAKTCATVAVVPARPIAGQLVELRLTTWIPRWDGNRARPAEPYSVPPSHRLEADARGPGERYIEIRYRRSTLQASVWRARVSFPVAGRWWINSPALWAAAPPTCDPTRSIVVR
jgi:hypothetical protein